MVGELEGQPTDDICPRFRSSSVIPNQYTPSPALFPFPRPPPPQKNTRPIVLFSGREIAPNTGANPTKFFTLETKS